jgi:hypothetical protein
MPDPSPLLGPPYVSLYNDIWGSRVRSNYEGATALESASSSWSSFAMLHRDNAICEILFWPLRLKLTTLTNFLNQRVIVGSLCRFFVSGAYDSTRGTVWVHHHHHPSALCHCIISFASPSYRRQPPALIFLPPFLTTYSELVVDLRGNAFGILLFMKCAHVFLTWRHRVFHPKGDY